MWTYDKTSGSRICCRRSSHIYLTRIFLKICNKCKITKPVAEFYRNKTKPDGLQGSCKSCSKEASKRWVEVNPDKYGAKLLRDRNDEAKRAKRYGISEDELASLLSAAGGLCTICGRPPIRKLVVDHCHVTNKVRGILCEKCNQTLGLMDDKIEYFLSAANYLQRSVN